MYRALIRSSTVIMLVKSIIYILRGCGLHFKWVYDTSSNDTLSKEPFRLKVLSSKWHFVEYTHCRMVISPIIFNENNKF